ncbi:MAG: bacteriocin [Eubacteriales bacterium]|nr:bacteriocin [Eubacteriales bacterium]
MKTIEELNTLKEEFEALQKKLSELTDEELEQVAGGQIVYVTFP